MDVASILFSELGQQIGIETLGFDEEGSCTLAFDDEIVITFLSSETLVYAVCYVGDWDGQAAIAAKLLAANFAWKETQGATLAIEPGSNRIVLCRQWVLAELQVGELIEGIEAVVNVAEITRASLEQSGLSGGDSASPAFDQLV